MHFESSPSSSPSKSIPISIGNMSSPTGSLYSNYSSSSSSSSSNNGSTCAYPSWPTGSSLGYRSPPSSFISDADLFGDDLDDLLEAPAPPRQPTMSQALPFLPPMYATAKPKKSQQPQQQRRRSSGRKQRRSSKPMTPISESPEAHRE
ncbi:unnamed protein product [Periconia digitata]|uniref:Uncharacterized protein n=1 Tax=Periconia digitata TaxID=1303443 RepID=A0A9W4U1Y6_9PLEO|nr:unnamed protein product [Periconia digitata]